MLYAEMQTAHAAPKGDLVGPPRTQEIAPAAPVAPPGPAPGQAPAPLPTSYLLSTGAPWLVCPATTRSTPGIPEPSVGVLFHLQVSRLSKRFPYQ